MVNVKLIFTLQVSQYISGEFHLPKRSNIYVFGKCRSFFGGGGGIGGPFAPSESATDDTRCYICNVFIKFNCCCNRFMHLGKL